jgi:hypothetical protein
MARAISRPENLVLLAALASAYFLQSRTYLNHDVAWVLWGTRAMIHGAVFGRDIIEPNPPLAWYLAWPPVLLADRFGWPIDVIYRLWVFVWAGVSVAALRLTLKPLSPHLGDITQACICATAGLIVFLLPGREFGQREHLALILILPYLGRAACLHAGCDRLHSQPGPILIGVAAGIGFAIKPYFYAVPLLIELAILYRHRSFRLAFRAETLSIAGVALLYLGVIFLWHRPYLDTAMPLASAIYWSFEMPLMDVLRPALVAAAALLLVGAQCAKLKERSLPLIFLLAAAGFLVAHVVQMKGYPYHALPMISCTLLALSALWGRTTPRNTRLTCAAYLCVAGLSLYSLGLWWVQFNRDFGADGRIFNSIIQAVNDEASRHEGSGGGSWPNGAKGGFLAISSHPIPGFPTALYVNAPWTSRTNSQWFLPAIVALREGTHPPDPKLLAFVERQAQAFIQHDLAARPWLIFVDTGIGRHGMIGSNLDFLTLYGEYPAFRELWKAYSEAPAIGRYRVFVRKDSELD